MLTYRLNYTEHGKYLSELIKNKNKEIHVAPYAIAKRNKKDFSYCKIMRGLDVFFPVVDFIVFNEIEN